MLVTTLSPSETIGWFEGLDRQHEILCFMICADPRHRAALHEICQNYIDSDVALGSKVAFIIFGGDVNRYPEVDFGQGKRTFLPGERLEPSPLRDRPDHRPWEQGGASKDALHSYGLDAYAFSTLAAETASASSAWMKAIGVRRQSLPVLCAMVRGNDPAVISLGDVLDASKLLKLFGRLADIAERDCEKAIYCTVDTEARLRRAIELQKSMKPLLDSLVQQMEAMCNRFKATPDERAFIADFLVRRDYSTEALKGVLSKCNFSSTPEFGVNSTVRGVKNKLGKLERAIAVFEECRPREGTATSLSDAVDAIRARRQETARLVRELILDGVDAKSVDRQSFGLNYDKYAARAMQAAALIEKVSKFISFVRGAGLIG